MNLPERHGVVLPCVNRETTERNAELLFAARAGSQVAFGELRNIYAKRLFKRILSITRNREDAEDALQDTFLRAYLALPSFEGRSQLSSWLIKIAINSALMMIRKRRSRPEVSMDQQLDAEDGSFPFDVRDHAPDPEQACDQKQRCTALLREIKKLPPQLRTPLHLRISKPNSMKEIAQDLGISPAALKTRLHRARLRLVQSRTLRNFKLNRIPPAHGTSSRGTENREQ